MEQPERYDITVSNNCINKMPVMANEITDVIIFDKSNGNMFQIGLF